MSSAKNVIKGVWDLIINGQVTGKLIIQSVDQPWVMCAFVPAPGFDEYSETFHQEEILLETDSGSVWEELFYRISEWDIRLRDENGFEIDNILLHINCNNEARFRY